MGQNDAVKSDGDATGNGAGAPTQVDQDLQSRRHKRETYRMLSKALRDGYDMPDGIIARAVETAVVDLESVTDSTRSRAREFLLSVRKHSVDAAIALDKLERLDSNEATENTKIVVEYVRTDAHAEGSNLDPA